MKEYLIAYGVLLLAHFSMSYIKSRGSWTLTKLNWTTNHKATLVSVGISVLIATASVYLSGYNTTTLLALAGFSGVIEMYVNKAKNV